MCKRISQSSATVSTTDIAENQKTRRKKDNNLIEVVESLVEVGHHASRRFVGDLDGHFENALWYAVRFA